MTFTQGIRYDIWGLYRCIIVIFIFLLGINFLTQKELEDIADKLNLDEWDTESDYIPNYDKDGDEENLLGKFPLPDEADGHPIDDFDSSE